METSTATKEHKSKVPVVIYISGFLDLFGVSLVLPLIMRHAKELGASSTVSGVLGSTYGALQLLSSPVVGKWSDRSGRHFVLLVCLFLSACSYSMFFLATSVVLLFLVRIPLGIIKHSQTISKAYLADISKVSEQSATFGNFNSASSLGFIVGPVVGGHIAEAPGGFYLVGLLSGFIFFINFVLIYWCVPDVPKKSSSLHRNESSVTSLRNLASEEANFSPSTLISSFKLFKWEKLGDLFLIKFLLGLAVLVFRSNFSLMLMQKFDSTTVTAGYVISFSSTVSVLIGFLVGWISKYYRNNAQLVLHLSVLQIVTLTALALSPSLWIFLIAMIPFSLSTTVTRIASTGLAIERCENQEAGILLGLQQSSMSLARMLSPLIAGVLQELSSAGPGLMGAFCCLLAVIIMIIRPQDPGVRAKKLN
ncbi:hypothetical protein ACJMK2_029097 [Sinanodonta woodiana]|uniref:Major facilitator superfamily (MFS) profile domain-containing protein n=1 Tax=Sinanodonta woodiana TaxID=1069815 RepID=A0ABD3XCZ1_SINWO